jgi:hypothetical protein
MGADNSASMSRFVGGIDDPIVFTATIGRSEKIVAIQEEMVVKLRFRVRRKVIWT